jgi:hypothetical protein
MKKNFRFGYRIGGRLAPNFGVIVVDVPRETGETIISFAEGIRVAFTIAGKGDIANKFVAEFRIETSK